MTLLCNLASFKHSYQLKDIQTYYLPSGVLALHNGFFLYNKIIATIQIQACSLIISKSILCPERSSAKLLFNCWTPKIIIKALSYYLDLTSPGLKFMTFDIDEMLNIKQTNHTFISISTSPELSKNRAAITAQLNSNGGKLS